VTRTAAVWEKTNVGGSFFTGTDRAFFSAPSIASIAWSLSRDIVEAPLEAIVWKPCWYNEALSGTEGKVAFLMNLSYTPWLAAGNLASSGSRASEPKAETLGQARG
jgi:hypothetical protein